MRLGKTMWACWRREWRTERVTQVGVISGSAGALAGIGSPPQAMIGEGRCMKSCSRAAASAGGSFELRDDDADAAPGERRVVPFCPVLRGAIFRFAGCRPSRKAGSGCGSSLAGTKAAVALA